MIDGLILFSSAMAIPMGGWLAWWIAYQLSLHVALACVVDEWCGCALMFSGGP